MASGAGAAASPIVLVAAGGLGREVLALLRAAGEDVAGFLDDSPALRGASVDGAPVLGGVAHIATLPDVRVLVCAGQGSARAALVARLAEAGVGEARWARAIHPGVEVPAGCVVGPGAIMLAGVVLTASVTVGAHVVAMPQATLTHDVVVEDFATLCAGATLGGGVVVGRAAYVGMNASVRQGVRVGVGAVLGMGGALLRDLPDGETWVGVPARPLGAASAGRHRAASVTIPELEDAGLADAGLAQAALLVDLAAPTNLALPDESGGLDAPTEPAGVAASDGRGGGA
ncbi:NeuD/PglB/VioB family sugar acetyltransferase [Cellulomonas cellasea]|uniref:NeuD/PglB/VioB family sugar acetyltransferase n=1 Tax=Cellulomonas cellasea TaxID=43670 RepID=UPI00338FB7CC